MKGLAISALAGILIASISSLTYADAIPITVVNESTTPVSLIIKPSAQPITIAAAAIKMFTGQYNYPADILIQSPGHAPQQCKWAFAPVGVQTPKLITLNISNDQLTRTQNCLLSWQ